MPMPNFIPAFIFGKHCVMSERHSEYLPCASAEEAAWVCNFLNARSERLQNDYWEAGEPHLKTILKKVANS